MKLSRLGVYLGSSCDNSLEINPNLSLVRFISTLKESQSMKTIFDSKTRNINVNPDYLVMDPRLHRALALKGNF